MPDVHEPGWRDSLRVLTPAEYLGLALIWPILGAIVAGGVILAARLMGGAGAFGFPPVDTSRVLFQFASWAAVTPVVVMLAIGFRPVGRMRGSVFIVHGAAALLIGVAELLVRNGGGALLHMSAGVAADVSLRIFAYAGIVVTTWSLLLYGSMLRAVDEERRMVAAATAADRRHIASTSSYFSLILGEVQEQLDHADRAEKLTLAMANLLREQLRAVSQPSWSMTDEVCLLDRFADVEALRGRAARITVDVSDDVSSAPVPPGWLADALSELIEDIVGPREISIILDADEQSIRGTIATGGHSLALAPVPRMRDAARSHLTFDVSALARPGSNIVPAVLMIAWVVTTAALLLRAIDHHYPVTGWYSLISPVRALTWIVVVATVLWRTPVSVIGRWKSMVALSIGSAWLAEWAYITTVISVQTGSLKSLRMGTAFALMGLGPAAYAMLTMGGALSVIRIARACAAILERESAARSRLSRLKANLLRQQMNPHFLFNALNSLAALVGRSRQRADAFIDKLRKFHGAIASCDRELVDVNTEIALTYEYLDIERTRFERPIAADVNVEPATAGALVPPLSIQSLVENAVKHGSNGGAIGVTIRNEGASLMVRVENRIASVSPSKTGIGLLLLRQRLEALFGSDAGLSVMRDGEMYCAELRVPRGLYSRA